MGKEWQHVALWPLFKGIWERARKEVQIATKISFIGISLNDFLLPGLKYLFTGKKGAVELVVATKAEQPLNDAVLPVAAARTLHALSESVGAELILQRSVADTGKTDLERFEDVKQGSRKPEVTVRCSFDEFLNTELELTVRPW